MSTGDGDAAAAPRTLETLGRARELAPYQDEPRQMRSGATGKSGALRLGFERRGGRTVLALMERQVPLLVQRALHWDRALPGMACATIIHTAGGVLQGDRSAVRIDLAPGAAAHLTTQSATRIHEMDANYAACIQDISLGSGAYLEYLPGMTIPHRHSRYVVDTRITLPSDATAIVSEVVMPGRTHHGAGERFEYDLYASTISAARPDGRDLFAERLLVQPGAWPVRATGAMGAFDVFGSLFVLTGLAHVDAILDGAEPLFRTDAAVVSGASRLPNGGGLLFRLLGTGSAPVKQRIRELWGIVRQEVAGAPVPDGFLWA
jgi:urease accessory protein